MSSASRRGIVGAEGLGAQLRELAAAGLQGLVAEERTPVPELHRLSLLVHPVLGVARQIPAVPSGLA